MVVSRASNTNFWDKFPFSVELVFKEDIVVVKERKVKDIQRKELVIILIRLFVFLFFLFFLNELNKI